MKQIICPTCISYSKVSHFFTANVFAKTAVPSSKIFTLLDNQNIILDHYHNEMKSNPSDMVRSWLDLISKCQLVRKIQIGTNNTEIQAVIDAVIENSIGQRRFVTTKEYDNDYKHTLLINNVTLMTTKDIEEEEECAAPIATPTCNEIVLDICDSLIEMIQRKQTYKLEDLHNDSLALRLANCHKYQVLDQSRQGESASGKGAGELGIFIKSYSGSPLSIIEAVRSNSCGRKDENLAAHLSKLMNNYDQVGFKANFFVIYCEAASFNDYAQNYANEFMSHLHENSKYDGEKYAHKVTKDQTHLYTSVEKIKIFRSTFVNLETNKERYVYQIIGDFHI
ncbi:hypothetical protein HQ393_12600 [Chitinibacter bivalviorum]|uniref:Uncharacterized protein n=1 Tax=Chitinibacter bivalviorum TaxID=2739434 RepID=A0A7H9BK25_9NEIS|nr:hypothetical protein [Chitinibacter bivalviorum]QLG89010.1 hypothetical protein HQ393_12600 [Chitinibacter bivalviorum]